MQTPIGQLAARVTFETAVSVPDGEGGIVETFQPLDPPAWRVQIRAATVRDLERAAAGTVIATATHIVSGRYHPRVTTDTRIVYVDWNKYGESRTRIFHINGVQNVDERDEEMILFCEEQLTTPPAAVAARPAAGTRPTRLARAWRTGS